jgi:hypothetical protein
MYRTISYRNSFRSRRGSKQISLVKSKGLNVKFETTAKPAKSPSEIFSSLPRQTQNHFRGPQLQSYSQIDKANRARSQKQAIEADFDMVTFRSSHSIVRKRNTNPACGSVRVAALDALSNDTNPAENDRLDDEI